MIGRTIFILFLCMAQAILIHAQFGINKNLGAATKEVEDPAIKSESEILREEFDITNDPELLEAIQLFAGMSPQELMETVEEMKDMFGDDPEVMREIEEVMLEISKLDALEIEENIKDLVDEEMVAMAMADTFEMLRNADESDWDKVLENKNAILDAVVSSGMMSNEEIELFRINPEAWEEELRGIWTELKNQADEDLKDEL